MTTKRHLLIGAVGLVKGKVREDGKAMVSICDELEPYFVSENLLEGAPFQVISLIVRYGTIMMEPELGKINRRYSELEVAVELPMGEVKKLNYDELRERFKKVTMDALIAVARKYDLPCTIWEQLRQS
ncbi:MAG: immunity protein 39 [Deltaproteobacteria bacterium]|nr:immunity protein 39 [Deltaproteobacteria bacterium]